MMKKSVKQVVIISSLVLVLLLAFAIYKNNANSKSDDSSYRQQLELYLEAAKESPQKSSEYAYFPNDDLRLAHEQSNMRLISYEIESSTKINPDLFNDKHEAKNFVFFNYLEEESWGKRVLAKLTHDIVSSVE